jgi:hypothetical protein
MSGGLATNFWQPKRLYLSITKFRFATPDLCADPAAVINNVLTFLQVQPDKALTTPARLAPRPLQLLPEVAKHQKLVERVLQPYINRWRL